VTEATLDDTTITLLWGDKAQFIRRITEYAEREGLRAGFVIPLPFTAT
jgi:hypothetical protein